MPESGDVDHWPPVPDYRYCPRCGHALQSKLVKAGEPERLVCTACAFVFFLDPKLAACAIFNVEGRIALGRRAIEPGYGKWVFPGGFVDRGETVESAALREAREEMGVELKLTEVVGVFSYPGRPVVIVVYAAELVAGTPQPCDECLEVASFPPEEIPWPDLAFSSTRDALREYVRRFYCPQSPQPERSASDSESRSERGGGAPRTDRRSAS